MCASEQVTKSVPANRCTNRLYPVSYQYQPIAQNALIANQRNEF
jgi:hypothetical protein